MYCLHGVTTELSPTKRPKRPFLMERAQEGIFILSIVSLLFPGCFLSRLLRNCLVFSSLTLAGSFTRWQLPHVYISHYYYILKCNFLFSRNTCIIHMHNALR